MIIADANGQLFAPALQTVAKLRLPASGTALPEVAVPIASKLVARAQ